MNLVEKIIYLRNIKHNHDTFRIFKSGKADRKKYSVYLGRSGQMYGLYVYFNDGKYELESIQKEKIIDEINKAFALNRKDKIKNVLKCL